MSQNIRFSKQVDVTVQSWRNHKQPFGRLWRGCSQPQQPPCKKASLSVCTSCCLKIWHAPLSWRLNGQQITVFRLCRRLTCKLCRDTFWMWDHKGPCPPHTCHSTHHGQHSRNCWMQISVPSRPKHRQCVTQDKKFTWTLFQHGSVSFQNRQRWHRATHTHYLSLHDHA